MRKKTAGRSHAVYIRKALPGIRTGSRQPGATVTRNFSTQGNASSRTHARTLELPAIYRKSVEKNNEQPLPKTNRSPGDAL